MTVVELLLAIYAITGGIILIVWRGAARAIWRWIALIGVLLSVAVLAEGSHRIEVVPMLVVAVIVAAVALRRSRRQSPPPPHRRRILAVALRCMAAVLIVFVVVLDAAFIEILDPLSNAPLADLFGAETPDFSQLAWPDAFEKLNDHLSRAYALGEWKRIDWKALHDVAAPKIAEAARTGDRASYYLALREYLWSMNDTHVGLSGDDGGLRHKAISGGYGIQFVRLDDGRTINHVLIAGGPAASQGMEWGATILRWNDMAVDDAVEGTSVLWSGGPGATHEGKRLMRLRFLTRAPIGTTATVVFQNPDETTTRTATLVAADDKFESWRLADLPASLNPSQTNIEWRLLPEGIGYVRIREVMPTLQQLLPDRVVQRAVDAFVRAGAKGVVIDVRDNSGGADKLVPRMMGFFVPTRQFYEHTTYYDEATSRFERQAFGTLWTEPRTPNFTGPIAVLVDEWCISSCEGFALIARRRAGGHVVGFHGTYGSFGMSGAEVLMPSGLTVEYPAGQSLDENGVVQLDGDWRLGGGVTPDIRVPLTADTVRAQFKEGHDVVLETAVQTLTARSRE